MASVMDLALESEESVPYEPNLAMSAAVGFAHYLRRRGADGTSYDSDASELKRWYREFGSDFRRFTGVIGRIVDADRDSFYRKLDRFQSRKNQFQKELSEQEISYFQRSRQSAAWREQNPRPYSMLNADQLSVRFCDDCQEPAWTYTMRFVPRVGNVCSDCIQNWTYCDRCGEYYPTDEDHYHPPPPRQGSQCTAPMERFRMPNKLLQVGYQPSDRIVRVVNSGSRGRIPEAAMPLIEDIVNEDRVSWDQVRLRWYGNQLTNVWATKEGNYPKRLKNMLYKQVQLKLSASQMERIGNVARQYMVQDDENFVEFTRKLNRSPEEFVHDGSCWFTGGRHRCILKQNGGMAMRLFESATPPKNYRNRALPDARAWVVPLRDDLFGVDDPMEASSFLLFNAYGKSAQEMASLLASMTGKRCVYDVDMADGSSDGMYVNSGGYLVSDEKGVAVVDLAINGDNINCSCVSHGHDRTIRYPYDDSDFSTALVSESGRKVYEGEEEEPDD